MNREIRKIIAQETLSIIENGKYAIDQDIVIITSAAVNTGVVSQREPNKCSDIPRIMKTRIHKVLALFAKQKCNTIILGAWGCGVFRNDPKVIAQLFKEVIEEHFNDVFKHIVFAIYSKNPKFINAFEEVFKKYI